MTWPTLGLAMEGPMAKLVKSMRKLRSKRESWMSKERVLRRMSLGESKSVFRRMSSGKSQRVPKRVIESSWEGQIESSGECPQASQRWPLKGSKSVLEWKRIPERVKAPRETKRERANPRCQTVFLPFIEKCVVVGFFLVGPPHIHNKFFLKKCIYLNRASHLQVCSQTQYYVWDWPFFFWISNCNLQRFRNQKEREAIRLAIQVQRV